MQIYRTLVSALLISFSLSASAVVRYVDVHNPTPASPYTDWSTAATNIQQAVDVASPGDQILVTNGVYQTGGRAIFGTMTNRVVINKAVTVQSVNGPAVTTIQGYQVPGSILGDAAVRCVYLTNGAFLSGFTLTNGATRSTGDTNRERSGAGLWCVSTNAWASNCVIVANTADYYGGGVYLGTLIDCTLSSNSVTLPWYGSGGGAFSNVLIRCSLIGNSAVNNGGGAYFSILRDCTLTGNWISVDPQGALAYGNGGGAYRGSLTHCVLTGNRTYAYGGGVYNANLTNCVLSGNVAHDGGGSSGGSLYWCNLAGNSAYYGGGGASGSLLVSCVISGNCCTNYGGGASGGTLNNCFLTGNSAAIGGGAFVSGNVSNCTFTGNFAATGGGVYSYTGGALFNCIVYFNSALHSADGSVGAFYSCCKPGLAATNGNIGSDPQLASASHLSANSPCRGAGNPAFASGTDIDGEPWSTPPSIGCDEYRVGAITGPLSAGISASFTNVAVGCVVSFVAQINGKTSGNVWDFGDGTTVSNQPWTSHAWPAPGDYTVTLTAYNETWPTGVSATLTIHVAPGPVLYVAAGSTKSKTPYDSWAIAAPTIQAAVDAVTVPGSLILVSNGVYSASGRIVFGSLSNRVAATVPVEIRSLNGPDVTSICGYQLPGTTNGDGAVRCVYLCSGSFLSGFTLTNGATRTSGDSDREQSGGALWCESTNAFASNCVMIANAADVIGGAVCNARLERCLLSGNTAGGGGGGADNAVLSDCILSNNIAVNGSGGGAAGGALSNCTIGANSALGFEGGGVFDATLSNCVLNDNSAQYGGGSAASTLNNCTLTGNSALIQGGGTYSGVLNNCIIYFNNSPTGPNCFGGTLNECCTVNPGGSPGGTGYISQDPLLASASHLSSSSPCRGAGSSLYASGSDIDGEAWQSPPSIGCDEYLPGAATGPLAVSISVSLTNTGVGIPIAFVARIEGKTSASTWDFGDGTLLDNHPYASHAWSSQGDYSVILKAINETWPGGITATTTIHVATAPITYVSANSSNPTPPFQSWATAAVDIQSAVDVAIPGAFILVSNGVYATGGRLAPGTVTNRVAVTKPVIIQSVNGPAFTSICGYQLPGITNGTGQVRCVYLANGASLSGFTLTNGAADSGGGLYCESTNAWASNCVMIANVASSSGGGAYQASLYNCSMMSNSANYGGGTYNCTLVNCTLSGNQGGGGASGGTLSYCTLTGNSGVSGGGAALAVLDHCTLTSNSVSYWGGGAYSCTLSDCVVTGNSSPAESGGGVDSCTLSNCFLTGNWAYYNGGGAFRSTLNQCQIVGNNSLLGFSQGGGAGGCALNNCLICSNSALVGGGVNGGSLTNCTLIGNMAVSQGGGAYTAQLNNCIVYYNSASFGGSDYLGGTLNFCCVPSMPTNGLGNITNAPWFADSINSNFRLNSNSPCINSGRNTYQPSGFDLDGNPRITGGTVDIGAYEYPTPSSVLSYAWAERYGIPTDGSADNLDPDGDRLNNWQEWLAGTNPTNAASTLQILSIQLTNNPEGMAVSWQSVSGASYFVQRATNLAGPPSFVSLQSNVAAVSAITVFVDTNAPMPYHAFYRVGIPP